MRRMYIPAPKPEPWQPTPEQFAQWEAERKEEEWWSATRKAHVTAELARAEAENLPRPSCGLVRDRAMTLMGMLLSSYEAAVEIAEESLTVAPASGQWAQVMVGLLERTRKWAQAQA